MSNVVKLEPRDTSLQFYDSGCRAIEQASRIDEVKEIDDKSVAVRAYARQVKNKKLEADAAVIRNRAQRKMGQLLSDMRREGSLSKSGERKRAGVPAQEHLKSLSDIGISRKDGARAVKLASVSESTFEKKMGEMRRKIETGSVPRAATDLVRTKPDRPSLDKFVRATERYWRQFIENEQMEKLEEIAKYKSHVNEQTEIDNLRKTLEEFATMLNKVIRRLK